MSESLLGSYDAEMAEKIARRLPGDRDIENNDPFYREVLNWCLNHHRLIELFPKIANDNQLFVKYLEECSDTRQVEAFALAIALRLDWLQGR